MRKRREESEPLAHAHGVPLRPGDRVLTPDGVLAEVVEVANRPTAEGLPGPGLAVKVRFLPGEAVGWYEPAMLRPAEEGN